MKENFKELEVNGMTYMVQYYPATQGTKIFLTLTKLVAEPIANGIGGLSGDINPSDADVSKFLPQAVSALMTNVEPEKTTAFIKEILSTTICEGEEISKTFNTHFAGKQGHMLKLVLEVLKFQFGDLGELLGESVRKGFALMNQKNKKTQPGPSI